MTPIWAHVGLTFPPARQYDLDFLDNVRTKPPCGMPKGKLILNFRAKNYVISVLIMNYSELINKF